MLLNREFFKTPAENMKIFLLLRYLFMTLNYLYNDRKTKRGSETFEKIIIR